MVEWAWQIERKYMAVEIKNWFQWYDLGKSPRKNKGKSVTIFRRKWFLGI